jgi:hypothetical protein
MATLNSWQKISRVLPSDFGDGASGSATISSDPNTRATITGSASSTSGTAGSTAFANGDLVMLHQTQGTGAGQWEINKIASGGGSTSLTFLTALHYSYGTGAQIIKIPRYTTVSISSHSPTSWNGTTGGIEVICAKISVSGSGTITSTGKGYRGATGQSSTFTGGKQGEGSSNYNQSVTRSYNTNGGGGGNFQGGVSTAGGGGGGSANYGSDGTGDGGVLGGQGGTSIGSSDLTTLFFGGGGGSGSTGGSGPSGVGGQGGSILVIFTKNLDISSGYLYNNGNNGGNYTGGDSAGGGGGGGGNTLIVCETATLGTSRVTVTGGTKGYGSSGNRHGGDGSVGRIAIHYKTSVTGTTSPTYTGVQDTTLKFGGNTGFFAFF